jgi:hypothetical protein
MLKQGIRLSPVRAAFVGLVLSSSQIAGAQAVAGTVVDSASRAPTSGVVVMLLDGRGNTLSRTLTATDGRYRLTITLGAVSLRAVRMGFRPRQILLSPEVLSGAGRLDFAIAGLPSLLETIRVVDQPNCRSSPDRAAAFALWEQSRAALLSSVVARSAAVSTLELFDYYRIPGETRVGVLSQLVESHRIRSTRPFGAARVTSRFVDEGFRTDSSGVPIYFAPDADVLLDERFTTAYCFRLAKRTSARPGQVGLAFDVARRKMGRVDIEGVLWVDSVARRLVELEFEYVGTDRQEAALKLGGRVSFVEAPANFALIDHWSLRMAALGPPPKFVNVSRVAPERGLEVHEVGGELRSAAWDSGGGWTASLGSVAGRLMSAGSPVPRTEVRLIGTDYRAVTDVLGAFRLTDIVPGRYVFGVNDSTLNFAGFELTRNQSMDIARGETKRTDIELPMHDDFLSAKCPRARRDSLAVLAGRVVHRDGSAVPATIRLKVAMVAEVAGGNSHQYDARPGKPIAAADTVMASWLSIYKGSAGVRAMFLNAADGKEGASGAFFICRIPRNTVLKLEAEYEGARGAQSFVTSTPEQQVFTLMIKLDR